MPILDAQCRPLVGGWQPSHIQTSMMNVFCLSPAWHSTVSTGFTHVVCHWNRADLCSCSPFLLDSNSGWWRVNNRSYSSLAWRNSGCTETHVWMTTPRVHDLLTGWHTDCASYKTGERLFRDGSQYIYRKVWLEMQQECRTKVWDQAAQGAVLGLTVPAHGQHGQCCLLEERTLTGTYSRTTQRVEWAPGLLHHVLIQSLDGRQYLQLTLASCQQVTLQHIVKDAPGLKPHSLWRRRPSRSNQCHCGPWLLMLQLVLQQCKFTDFERN